MNILNESILRTLGTQGLLKKGRQSFEANTELIKEAREFTTASVYDVFLSHRTTDAVIVFGLKEIIEKQGLSVFVYWIENPQAAIEPVTRETADNLRKKMRSCRSLLYADSETSGHSKWMPWELGYVDGFRQKVAIIPVASGTNKASTYKGQEYLGLYPWVRESATQNDTLTVVDRGVPIANLKPWVSS